MDLEPIVFSRKAVERLLMAVADHRMDHPEAGIRIGVKGGGCAGFIYDMDVDLRGASPRDKAWSPSSGLVVFVDPVSLQYLAGTTIDFITKGVMEGFSFRTPGTQQCGCGHSFTA